MISTRTLFVLLAALGLSACAAGTPPASRGAMPAQIDMQQTTTAAPVEAGMTLAQSAMPFDIEAITVTVPRSLKVSEANTFKPRADIVWRGEVRGDRHAQVHAIFVDAMTKGTATLQSGRKVNLEIEVTKFHALTEKTRYTIGGMHEMRFNLTVRDAASGMVLDGPRAIVADVKAAGGSQAVAEEQAGLTQRVVTVERLAQVIRRELTPPPATQIISRAATPPAPILQ